MRRRSPDDWPTMETDQERAERHERERLESNERYERERKDAAERHELERRAEHERSEKTENH